MTTAVLSACQDEDGVAFVLSHEIGHVLAGHTVEDKSREILVQLSMPAWPAIVSMGRMVSRSKIFLGVYVGSIVFGFMVLDSWLGRNRESEADYVGLYIMSQAGYDTRRAVNFFVKLDSRRREIVDFYRSHGHNTTLEEPPAPWHTHPKASSPQLCSSLADGTPACNPHEAIEDLAASSH